MVNNFITWLHFRYLVIQDVYSLPHAFIVIFACIFSPFFFVKLTANLLHELTIMFGLMAGFDCRIFLQIWILDVILDGLWLVLLKDNILLRYTIHLIFQYRHILCLSLSFVSSSFCNINPAYLLASNEIFILSTKLLCFLIFNTPPIIFLNKNKFFHSN